jgi:predicted transcriptional regulator
MSGEQWLKRFGLIAIMVFCIIFVVATLASADESEKKDDNTNYLLNRVNFYQESNGSWNNDTNLTVMVTWANSQPFLRDEIYYEIDTYERAFADGVNWTFDNYHDNYSVETKSIITMSSWNVTIWFESSEYDDFRCKVTNDLITNQHPNGSWNNDIGDTAIATYALGRIYIEETEVIENGLYWLQEQKDEDEFTWGSIENDSKSIMALDSAGFDVQREISALTSKQKPDGSFGGIEDTAWATIALSIHSDNKAKDRAMAWLRSQKYENNYDLAIAAFAEQHYENAKYEEKHMGKGGSDLILSPFLLILFLIIIGSLVLSYWLFAKINKDDVMNGVRKEIYIYIAKNPGEYLANITKALGLSCGSVRYHLTVLEGMEKIVSHKYGKYRRYYINQNGYSKYMNGNGYKHIMSALKNNTARKIVKFLISNPDSNQKRVSNALKIGPSTVHWHIKRLKDAEIIGKHKKGKEIVYFLNQDVQLKKVIGIIEGSVA